MRVRRVELPDAPVILSQGLELHSRPPFGVEPFWIEWLGRQGMKPMVESNCLILSHRTSATPTILDAEYEDLNQRAFRLQSSLMLEGSLAISDGLMVLGGVAGGTVSIVQVA